MKRIKKGEYGYRNSMKRGLLFKIAILAAFILAQLGARWLTDSTALKNLVMEDLSLSSLPVTVTTGDSGGQSGFAVCCGAAV